VHTVHEGCFKFRYYNKIFLLEQIPFVEDNFRSSDRAERDKIELMKKIIYSYLGYEVVFVPSMPIEKRVSFVEGHIM